MYIYNFNEYWIEEGLDFDYFTFFLIEFYNLFFRFFSNKMFYSINDYVRNRI